MGQKRDRIRYLVDVLNKASKAYYGEDREIMSNFEYDKLYDELEALEKECGMVLANSPTVKVGYQAVEELPKERHQSPMLSLDKTKERETLREWLKDKEGLLSWKLDGLTIVLTYNQGKLVKAVTRGNGEVGEVITGNARTFMNLPLEIPFKGELVLRGEAVIGYSDFNKINESMPESAEAYKNPRNLCSGSVRQLNSEITAQRRVKFFAFNLVSAEDTDFHNSKLKMFEFLSEQGFEVVEHYVVTAKDILERIEFFAQKIEGYDIPSDGLVLTYNDIEYGKSLGRTAKFPRDSIAFKWADDIKETSLKYVEWSASRTGLINPVAVFDSVELEGTSVSRASLHNLSIVEALELGEGDTLQVYKANMIIPQIAENLTRSNTLTIPDICPVCGGKLSVVQEKETKSLYCTNDDCAAKQIKSFAHFVSRDAINIEGLSEATLEKFVDMGFIREFADIYHLSDHREAITSMEGFGEKSFNNLMEKIEQSRKTTCAGFLSALGILNVGGANAKLICRHFNDDLNAIENATCEEIASIDHIGEVIASSLYDYMHDPAKKGMMDRILKELEIVKEENTNSLLSGKTFVITGSLEHFSSRNDLKDIIEKMGGKVSGSISAKTECLINNDINSASSKNKKAKELGIRIVSEDDFIKEYEIPV
ncbi:MAG: NAD-dependent DNA ligase LigA [Lachnospiraceae bacterium]|nr:NAD-dependent DNA ligase LigA [Lachnospiraceae bacterium]